MIKAEFFTKLDSDTNGDLFCDLKEEVISLVDNENVLADKGRITRNELKDLFTSAAPEKKEIVKNLRKCLSLHPLEWNASLYEGVRGQLEDKGIGKGLTDEQVQYFENAGKTSDIWGGIGGLDDLKNAKDTNENLLFAHPVYFLNHLDQAGCFRMNPYLGSSITQKANGGKPKTILVTSSPGFAPIYDITRTDEKAPEYTTERKRYAIINGLFNQDYLEVERANGRTYRQEGWTVYNHKGVDFRGSTGTQIISFISGKVSATGWMNNYYGRIMLIRDESQDLLYFLAHLHRTLIPEGESVHPEQAVAEVGGSGVNEGMKDENAWVTHLHLEVWKSEKKTFDMVFKKENGYLAFQTGKNNFSPSRFDPLDHSKELMPDNK